MIQLLITDECSWECSRIECIYLFAMSTALCCLGQWQWCYGVCISSHIVGFGHEKLRWARVSQAHTCMKTVWSYTIYYCRIVRLLGTSTGPTHWCQYV